MKDFSKYEEWRNIWDLVQFFLIPVSIGNLSGEYQAMKPVLML